MESLPTESTNSADHLSEARPDRELPGDNFLGQETPLVGQFNFLYVKLSMLTKPSPFHARREMEGIWNSIFLKTRNS